MIIPVLNFTRKKRYTTIISFDPDVDYSGVAIINLSTREMILDNWSFPHIVDQLQAMSGKQSPEFLPRIIVEGGWLVRKSNFHYSKAIKGGERIAKNVGSNHEVGKLIIQMAQHYGIDAEAVYPLEKVWKSKKEGVKSKIGHEEFCSITGYTKRTNEENRDAGILGWIHAGFPVRVSIQK